MLIGAGIFLTRLPISLSSATPGIHQHPLLYRNERGRWYCQSAPGVHPLRVCFLRLHIRNNSRCRNLLLQSLGKPTRKRSLRWPHPTHSVIPGSEVLHATAETVMSSSHMTYSYS